MYALNLRTLIVDPSRASTQVAQRLMAALGQDLIAVGSVPEALALMARECFDLILVALDGSNSVFISTVKSVRGLPGHAHTPVIGLTDKPESDLNAMCLEAGLTDVHSHELKLKELRKALSTYLIQEPALVVEESGDADGPVEVLSRRILENLRAIDDNDGAFVNELIDLFESLTPPVMIKLAKALAAGEEDETVSLAHKLKGMCRNLGIMSLAATLDNIEMFYPTLSADKKLSLPKQIEQEYKEAVEALHSHWYRLKEIA